MKPTERALILAQLFRLGNSALLGFLAVFSVAATPHGDRWNAGQMALLFVSWTSLAATAYAVNDLVDRVRDRVNRPNRYLQQVARTPPWIISSVWVIAAISFVTGAFVPLGGFLQLAAAWSVCAIGYSFGLKQRSGLLANLLTAFCVATSASPGLLLGFSPSVLSLLSVLFLLMTAREVWKDIEDEPGDAAAGLRTLPILRGRAFAARCASVVTAAGFLVLIVAPPLAREFEVMAMCVGILGITASTVIFRDPNTLPARQIQRAHRYAAIVVFAIFVGGSGVI